MIIGGGLIAKTLVEFKDTPDVIIFASGVSNSQEVNSTVFAREKDLLLSQERDKTIIYFSTCSIFDATAQQTMYVKHKVAMEALLRYNFPKFKIIRLPTVLGNNNNPHTLFNHILNKINLGEEVTVVRGAWRYLLDVDDLKIIIPLIVKTEGNSMNVTYGNVLTVLSIVEILSALLNKGVKINLVNGGIHLHINNSEFKKLLLQNNCNIYSDEYNVNCLKKYLTNGTQ